MVRTCILFVISSILLGGIGLNNVFATHVMGGDIYYNDLGNNLYEVTVIIYRDCNSTVGINPNLTISSASLGQNIAPNMPQVAGPLQITPTNNTGACVGSVSICQEQNVFRGTVTLPPAADWVFAVNQACCRNAGNNLPILGSQYIEATLNNATGVGNSSPTFFGSGVHVLCLNSDYVLDPGICELDGDSMAFSLIETRQNVNNSTPYVAPFTAANPLPSNPAVNLDPLTGEISIRPIGSPGYVAVFAMRIDEYRNGVKVGSVVREYQIYYIVCPTVNTPPTFGNITNLSGGVFDGDKIDVCPGDTLKFDIAGLDLDANDTLSMRDSLPLAGAILTNTINGNSVTGSFCWVAPMNPQKFHMVFKLQDNACPVYASTVKVLTINIQDGSTILGGAAQFACSNGSNPATLTAYGGSRFNWSVVSGDMNSLNGINVNAASIQVNPTTTTTYTVATDFVCNANAPQVVVNVVNPPTVATSADVSVCGLQTVPLTTNVAGGTGGPFKYTWFPAATVSNATSANPSVSPQDTTAYIVSVLDSASGCIVMDTIQVNVSAPFLGVSPTLSSTSYCPGSPPVSLVSNAQAGNCSSYKAKSIPHNPTPVNPTAGQVIALGLGSTAGPINMGFNMEYFCQSVSSFHVSSGGWLSFNNPNGSPSTGAQQLPSASFPNNIIAFLWADFIANPFAGSFLNYISTGTAPNRIGLLTLTNGLSANNNSNQNTVQVKLFEATGDIEVHITRANAGTNATIGVEGPAGGQGIAAPGRNQANFTVTAGTEEAWRFSFDRGAPYTVTWYEQPFPPNLPIGTGDSIQVTPNAPTTYCAVVQDNQSLCSDTFCYPNQVTAANLVANGPPGPLLVGATANLTSNYTGPITPNCTDYVFSQIPFAPEPTGGTVLTMGDDDTQGPFNLGFTFDWYCNPVSQIWINSNGWVSFVNPNSNQAGPFTIPDPTAPVDLISFLATDLEPNIGGTIQYQTIGNAGSRRFVLTFTDVPFYASNNLVTVQMILYEGSDNVEVHCTRVDSDPIRRITQGIQETTTNGEFAPGRNNILLTNVVTNDAIRFRPQVNNVTYSWTSANGNGVFQDSTLIDPVTNPLGAAGGFYTFYVQADNGDCILYDTVIVPIGILPIEEVQFAAQRESDRVTLDWSLIEYTDIQRFTIEHAFQNEDFAVLDIISKTADRDYTFNHLNPTEGLNRYRLRITNSDGSIRYSQIEEVYWNEESAIAILPNPGSGDFVLQYDLEQAGTAVLRVMDTQGRLVFGEQLPSRQAGIHNHRLDLNSLSAGVYVYEVLANGKAERGKLVVR